MAKKASRHVHKRNTSSTFIPGGGGSALNSDSFWILSRRALIVGPTCGAVVTWSNHSYRICSFGNHKASLVFTSSVVPDLFHWDFYAVFNSLVIGKDVKKKVTWNFFYKNDLTKHKIKWNNK